MATNAVSRQNSVCLGSLLSMRSFAIEDPRSPDPALYATLGHTNTLGTFLRRSPLWRHMIGRVVLDEEYVQCMNVLRGTISESAAFLYKSSNTSPLILME